ncbi:transposase [Micromonospora chokoriensis]
MWAICASLAPGRVPPALDAIATALNKFAETWDGRYPATVWLCENAWAERVLFLVVDNQIRNVVCSTNGRVFKVSLALALVGQATTPLQTGRRGLTRWLIRLGVRRR